jgi:hypothetical protein
LFICIICTETVVQSDSTRNKYVGGTFSKQSVKLSVDVNVYPRNTFRIRDSNVANAL